MLGDLAGGGEIVMLIVGKWGWIQTSKKQRVGSNPGADDVDSDQEVYSTAKRIDEGKNMKCSAFDSGARDNLLTLDL